MFNARTGLAHQPSHTAPEPLVESILGEDSDVCQAERPECFHDLGPDQIVQTVVAPQSAEVKLQRLEFLP